MQALEKRPNTVKPTKVVKRGRASYLRCRQSSQSDCPEKVRECNEAFIQESGMIIQVECSGVRCRSYSRPIFLSLISTILEGGDFLQGSEDCLLEIES